MAQGPVFVRAQINFPNYCIPLLSSYRRERFLRESRERARHVTARVALLAPRKVNKPWNIAGWEGWWNVVQVGARGWRHPTGFRLQGSSFRLRGGAIFSVSITRPVKPTWNKRRGLRLKPCLEFWAGDWSWWLETGEVLDIFAVLAIVAV